jgi:hypothetical protein
MKIHMQCLDHHRVRGSITEQVLLYVGYTTPVVVSGAISTTQTRPLTDLTVPLSY